MSFEVSFSGEAKTLGFFGFFGLLGLTDRSGDGDAGTS